MTHPTCVHGETDPNIPGLWIITLNRPKANAIDVATSQALYAAFARLQHDPQLRAGIITGTGRFFSAGWDLNAAQNGEAITADHGPGGFAGLTEFFALNKPVIAAVNGLAIGGGFELALAADLLVCSSEARFALPEVKLGMLPDSGGILRLPKRLPAAVMREMLLTGCMLDAQQALQYGLVNRVCPPADLMACAKELAQSLIAAAPLALAAAKEVLQATEHLSLREAYALLRSGQLEAYQTMLQSADAQEGPRAFAEKRAPQWRGL